MKEVSSAGKLLAEQRVTYVRSCEVCGTQIEGVATRRYCSGACRYRAYYRRHREEVLAKQKAARAERRADTL